MLNDDGYHLGNELHRDYFDVHVILEGTEYFKMTHKDQLIHQTDYDEAGDILFG
ncbi:YhcH/YjgK/YiaL family protein, partial [Erysipelothrix rhusiopathiae]|nr:YhcH/YjgK/YiaL family protein [Erysipelothrix rhusiopathiae]